MARLTFLLSTLLSLYLNTSRADQTCWTNNCTDPITLVEAPWTIYGTGYAIVLPAAVGGLPDKTYSPLERSDPRTTAGLYTGVVGALQIIRYTDTPVGPYDEFVLIPGEFTYAGPHGLVESNLRVSRMYVSQKYTCYNGRANWNIPKHLADFHWTDNADGSTSVKIHPYDTTGDESESYPAEKPFFQATFYPEVPGVIPLDFGLLFDDGVPVTLGQPPLPQGNGSYGELPGTESWGNTVLSLAKVSPGVSLFDLDQGEGDVVAGGDVNAVGDEFYRYFWPGLGRWNEAVKLEDFTIIFEPATEWNTTDS